MTTHKSTLFLALAMAAGVACAATGAPAVSSGSAPCSDNGWTQAQAQRDVLLTVARNLPAASTVLQTEAKAMRAFVVSGEAGPVLALNVGTDKNGEPITAERCSQLNATFAGSADVPSVQFVAGVPACELPSLKVALHDSPADLAKVIGLDTSNFRCVEMDGTYQVFLRDR